MLIRPPATGSGPLRAPATPPVTAELEKIDEKAFIAPSPTEATNRWGIAVTTRIRARATADSRLGAQSKRRSKNAWPAASTCQPKITALAISRATIVDGAIARASSCGTGTTLLTSRPSATTIRTGRPKTSALRQRRLISWPLPGMIEEKKALTTRRVLFGPASTSTSGSAQVRRSSASAAWLEVGWAVRWRR